MAEKTDPKPPETTPPPEGGPLKMADIRKLVQDTVKEVVGTISGGEKPPAGDPPPTDDKPVGGGLRAQVEKEIQRIRDKETQETRDKTIDQQLADLAEKTKEKAPVERSRRHKIMRWGD